MSAPFRWNAAVGAVGGPLGEQAAWTAGRRLDVPLRMAQSLGVTLARFSAEGGGAVPDAAVDPVSRLVMGAVEVSGDRSPEDMVADALDRLPWTAPLVEAARDRPRWDGLWREAVGGTQMALLAFWSREEWEAAGLRRAERERREGERREWERQARERYGRPGPGAAGSVERAAFVFRFCGVPGADRLDAAELRAAWVALMRRHHPDAAATAVDVQEINAAYDVLRGRWAAGAEPTGRGRG